MNDDEKEFIRDNIPRLIELTECNVMFLAIMEQERLLCASDREEITETSRKMVRAQRFYDIIIKRSDSFEKLKKAMELTTQTGALDVLKKFERKTGAKQEASHSSSSTMQTPLSEVDIYSIVDDWINSQVGPTLSTSWTKLAYKVRMNGIKRDSIRQKLNTGQIELLDAVIDILNDWIQNSNEVVTLQSLVTMLDDLQMREFARLVKTRHGLS